MKEMFVLSSVFVLYMSIRRLSSVIISKTSAFIIFGNTPKLTLSYSILVVVFFSVEELSIFKL